jgi:leucyl aminopeptidase
MRPKSWTQPCFDPKWALFSNAKGLPFMKISFSEKMDMPKSGMLAVGIEEGGHLPPAARSVDEAAGGAISRALSGNRFNGKKGESLTLIAPSGLEVTRIVLFGVGKELAEADWLKLGGSLVKAANGAGDKDISVLVDCGTEDLVAAAASVAEGARLGAYRFDKYFTKKKAEDKPSVKSLSLHVSGAAAARKAFKPRDAVVDGVYLTRDVVTEPPNILYPETLAARCKELEELGVKVEILNEKKMAKLGMGALLGVGQGSIRESFLVTMRWDGGPKNQAPVAFVGKGVTFDTGGISLKPGPGMEEMKWDMGGSGTVLGVMKALAGRKAKVNVVGVVGLVENMPDGNAQRPGDVVTSMSGQTIEIHNTDAEGRLVLADALWYTQQQFKPQAMIDLATLTGAIIIALGNENAGLFSNDDTLSAQLTAAGLSTGEPVWRLPLGDAYDKLLTSDCADMKNIGGRGAGSITAAQFLQRFVKDTAWAHLDIAGMAWTSKDSATVPKGATGYGVRMLDRFVTDVYEN